MPTDLPSQFRGPQAERTIAAARVLLAVSSLFAIWIDPAEPARFAGLTYSLHSIYVIYATGVLAIVWWHTPPQRAALVTHVADVIVFSVFQYLTLGPSSPFFVYFIFSVFCGAVRWGWHGALSTAAVVLVAFVSMGTWMSRTLGASEFELNRFLIRAVYLAMVAWLLVYLGRHEARLRQEIQRLAHWPVATGGDLQSATARLLHHAASIIGASRATLVWGSSDEPWMYLASWSEQGTMELTRHPPIELEPIVEARSGDAAFVSAAGSPFVHNVVRARIGDGNIASAPFHTDRVSGRAFFSGLREPTADLVALVEVVVRELGASIGERLAQAQVQQLAIREERIRVARDLHDGVLQSMTGIRFELQAMANNQDVVAPDVRDRLLAIERALSIEQRELRLFIDDLRPLSQPPAAVGRLAARLEELRRRLADEWKQPITIRVADIDRPLPAGIEGAVPLMAQEAIINALKHARPSKVTVDVGFVEDRLAITVCDDGRGFAFRGRYDHQMLERQNAGPVSLRERVTALGGRLTIESAATGSRLEIELPLPTEEPAWRSA